MHLQLTRDIKYQVEHQTYNLSCPLSNGPAPEKAKSEYLDAVRRQRALVDEVDAEEVQNQTSKNIVGESSIKTIRTKQQRSKSHIRE